MITMPYDETSPLSIEAYSQKLIGKTFAEILKEDCLNTEIISETFGDYGDAHENKNRKGGLGELIEERFFHYKCNNDSKPDFYQAGVELKVTPYKINKNRSFSAKERLIITMIDYFKVVDEDFFQSHLWAKSELILLVYYLYSKEINNRLDYTIKYSKLFTPTKEDIEIIKHDYETIINKIKAGKAHELSESDTLYLGAATKSSTSLTRRGQPFSNIDAKPRAFSFKGSYMTYILNSFIVPNKTTYEPIIKNINDLNGTTFESYIINRIGLYLGKSDKELCDLFDREYNNNKSQWSDISYRILGIKSNQAEEFIKANIVVKAIRLEENNTLIESMSLPSFDFKDLVNQDWEDSDLFTYFNETRFLFVVYKKAGDKYILKGSQLWNMPYNDLNTTVYKGWNNVRTSIINGIKFTTKQTKSRVIINNTLPKKSSNAIVHIRPHAQKSAYLFSNGYMTGNISQDANELPDGQWMTTQSFWINNSYILKQLNQTIIS
ncbi:restriction endonuclease [Clostridium gasigenes]|uniref:Sau3AI family type II restriction endonuclease n=1 Tax=Clostridium gasigenes TaxID=94869 RepID=UPI001C0B2C79|nr:Sau3AI family type II restriction endonuclease [Clostridium gasigenes]MBU3131033.1 restriction endonuclease [Clostridium gasigenes]